MFFKKSFLIAAIAGTTLGSTPPGFEPASSQDFELGFCDNLAVNGASVPQDEIEMSPSIGTKERLVGTFAIIMVDTDVPSAGGGTEEFLHFIQTGLTSSTISTFIAGQELFELENKDNLKSIAAFIQPNPPNLAPTTHKYVSLLLNTTGNDEASPILETAAGSRRGFNIADVVSRSGAAVVAGNFFTVTNAVVVAAAGKVEVRDPLEGVSEEEKRQPMHIYRRNFSAAPTTLIVVSSQQNEQPGNVQPATPGIISNPGAGSTPGQAEKPQHEKGPQRANNTLPDQRTTIIVRLSQVVPAHGGQNQTTRILTTPLVLPDGPGATGTGSNPGRGQPTAVPAPFPSGNSTAAPVASGTAPNPGATDGAGLPDTTTGGVPAPTGGAISLRGDGYGILVLGTVFAAMMGL